ncbi:hypothetical protein FQA39_LY04555 [Lamprigera yunnana]|nr:hypothetical protein FQA39_LY04555 [Lamprigera yunnana]
MIDEQIRIWAIARNEDFNADTTDEQIITEAEERKQQQEEEDEHDNEERLRTAVNVVTSHVIVLRYEFKDMYEALVMRNRNLAVTDNDIRFGHSLDKLCIWTLLIFGIFSLLVMIYGVLALSEVTVDAVTDIGEKLICSIAFGELMVFTVIPHTMGRGCINAYVSAPSN